MSMNSRWTTAPITRNGQIVTTRHYVEGDVVILKTLGTYGLLTADYIAACNGRSYGAVIARLSKLKRKPLELIRVCPTQFENPRQHQYVKQAFQLSGRGIARLIDLGFEPKKPASNKHFAHSIMEAQTAASLSIGAQKFGLRHVVPSVVPMREPRVIPDIGPVGLGYGDLYRFVCVETDCATEPISSSSKDRQSIQGKFAAYLRVLAAGLYKTTWRIPNLTVLFTTTTQVRMNSMMMLLSQMTDDPVFLRCFGFQKFETIFGNQPDDKSWAVTQPWVRVVNSPLNLAEK